jgi:hypothetical protein
MWTKIKAWFKHSLTIAWARAVTLFGFVLAALETTVADRDLTGALQAALEPQYVPYYVIAIGLVTELARRRTAGTSQRGG